MNLVDANIITLIILKVCLVLGILFVLMVWFAFDVWITNISPLIFILFRMRKMR